MARRSALAALAALAACCGSASAAPPKVIWTLIVDDLGWGDVPWHRPANSPEAPLELPLPNFASLVSEGVELDRHYVYATCSPSRASFLSGRLPVHVQQTLANPEQPNAGVPRNMTSIAQKLKAQGYATHVVGKWDLGMATPAHTPAGRGFDSSLIYYEHKVDYWTQELMQSSCEQYDGGKIVDFWAHNASSPPSGGGVVGGPAHWLNGTDYVEYLFRDAVLDIIAAHNESDGPLYLHYTPHVAHTPLQVPPEWLAKFNFSDDEVLCDAGGAPQTPYIFPGATAADYRCRNQYEAMVALLDDAVGQIVSALQARGWWEETLMLASSDNGGPLVIEESGANNAPHKGGKYSDWEGGVRATAFASGGYLPPAVRGSKQEGVIALADWYVTLCSLAGGSPSFCTSDAPAAASGLPPIDSLDFWPLLSGANATSPRAELPISSATLIQGRFKLILGAMPNAMWTGWTFPNATTATLPAPASVYEYCGKKPAGACLYDVVADPSEHTDIGAANPAIVSSMRARLAELSRSFYSNNETGTNVPECAGAAPGQPCACYLALPGNKWDGFFGPYQL